MTTTSDRPAHRQTQEFRTHGDAGRNSPDQGTTVNTSTTHREEGGDVTRHQALDEETLGNLACRRFDAELWFAESPEDVELAKSLCTGCPLATACLTGALERNEPWGVWGGQLVLGGTVVARKRPRGRPRKHPVAA